MENFHENKKFIIRNFFKVFIPVFLIFFIFLGISFFYNVQIKRKILEIRILAENHLQKDSLDQKFDNIISDMFYLSHNTVLMEKVLKNNVYQETLLKEFQVFSKYKKIYHQIRILDIDGMERVRVNFNKGNPVFVKKDSLQMKKHRYYFSAAMKLDKDSIYISPMDLNIENKKIEMPINPMIRFSIPVFDSSEKKIGVFVLNYSAKVMLDRFEEVAYSSLADAMVVNNEGYWLKSKDPNLEWGFMFKDKKNVKFSNVYPKEWNIISKKDKFILFSKKGLFVLDTLYPLVRGSFYKNYSIKVISYLPRNKVILFFKDVFILHTILFFVGLIFIFIVSYFLSIAKNKKIISELEMRKAIEIKEKFISIASHELKNPLFAIREGISLVLEEKKGKLNDEQKEILGIAQSSSQRLSRLSLSLLDFEKLTAGKMEFSFEKNNINEVIKQTAKSLELLIVKKNLFLDFKLDDNIPIIIFDKDKIIQVVINLMNNAIKFTGQGGITIASKLDKEFVQVMVQDTGLGMKDEDKEKVFEGFRQLSNSANIEEKGAGLGLAISKEIISAHNGTIFVESEVGKGSSFIFTLPKNQERALK